MRKIRKVRRMDKPKREISFWVNGIPVYEDEGVVSLYDPRFNVNLKPRKKMTEEEDWAHKCKLVDELTEKFRKEGRIP